MAAADPNAGGDASGNDGDDAAASDEGERSAEVQRQVWASNICVNECLFSYEHATV